jgi:hypothetical protein
MGSLAATLYFCKSYLAVQHDDDDLTPGISIQLTKNCADPEGYHFANTEYNFYIATEPNTAW